MGSRFRVMRPRSTVWFVFQETEPRQQDLNPWDVCGISPMTVGQLSRDLDGSVRLARRRLKSGQVTVPLVGDQAVEGSGEEWLVARCRPALLESRSKALGHLCGFVVEEEIADMKA
jgi:hypothetical protein